MSRLRSECVTPTSDTALPNDTDLFLIRDAVARRRSLIHGRLDGPHNSHCAIGAFWADNPGQTLRSSLIDEVAAVNDSVPPTRSTQERWKKVNEWLRWKIKALAGQK